MYVDDQAVAAGGQATTAALDTDAEKLASMLDSEVRAAHLRADGIATMPMLRAAIETDAATLKDMVGTDFIFTPKPGEVLELFQLRERGPASLLRIPDGARPVEALAGNQTRIASDGRGLTITVGAPIARQQAGVGGAVVLSVPLDLTLIKKRVADHARSAQIVGFGAPVVLADGGTAGTPVTVAIPLSSDLRSAEVALAAVVAPPAYAVDGKLRIARIACWSLAAALFVLYLVSLLPRRKRS
jgi:hypothetical protein